MNVNHYPYERKNIKTGILHIGVGNFHRAHQAFYTNQLLNDQDQSNWGICGVCLLPNDEKIVDKLRAQNLNYTLTVCGRDGNEAIYQIGSLQELIWAPEGPAAVFDKIADNDIKIITLTITEGGYNIDKSTKLFMLNNELIRHDLENPSRPKTVFGFVAQGLRQRMKRLNSSITILSCDNLQHNGNTARMAFTTFIAAQDKELAAWVADYVTFPNSMVDRITPATTAEDVERLNKKSGIADQTPVYCEDFIQWVIEDNFIAGRPAWERVGVEFTDDVTTFENMKLGLLNASHTLLSYPAFIKGYRKVDEAMHDEQIIKLVRDFMDIDITPLVPAPKGVDLEAYKQTLIERFANPAVSDQISRLCADGLSKFPIYIMHNLKTMIGNAQELERHAFLFAAYRHYLKYKTDDLGQAYQIAEPWITSEDQMLIDSDTAIDFLDLSAFKNEDLKTHIPFLDLYMLYAREIKEKGIRTTLQTVVT